MYIFQCLYGITNLCYILFHHVWWEARQALWGLEHSVTVILLTKNFDEKNTPFFVFVDENKIKTKTKNTLTLSFSQIKN